MLAKIKSSQVCPFTLHPSTALDHRPQWVLYDEFVFTSQNFIRVCTRVDGPWLLDTAEHYYDLDHFPECSAKRDLQRLLSQRRRARNYREHARHYRR